MDKPLRILHLEDQPDFSTLVSELLEKEGLGAELVLVTDYNTFTDSLEKGSFDLILADYSLPTCNGKQALEAACKQCPEVPFLLLSGAIGEHAAVDILKSGATDYVLKSGMERLVPAIRRAVQEARSHSQLKRAEAEAHASERQYRIIFNASPVPMWVSDLKTGAFLEVNEAAIRHYGYARDEFLSRSTKDICLPDELTRLSHYVAEAAGKGDQAEIGRAGFCPHRKKDGTLIEVDIAWSIIQFREREALLTMAHDVTPVRPATEMLKKSEARLAAAMRPPQGNWELELSDLESLDRNKLLCPEETCRILGFHPGRTLAPSEFFFNPVHPEDLARVKDVLRQAFRNRQSYSFEHRIILPDGRLRHVKHEGEFLQESGKALRLRGTVTDLSSQPAPAEPPAPLAQEEPTQTSVIGSKPMKRSRPGRQTGFTTRKKR